MDRVRHGPSAQFTRGEPTLGVPLANAFADLSFAQLEGQETFRSKGILYLFVRHEGGGAAETAALTNFGGVEDGDGLAALAPDARFRGLPTAGIVGNSPEGSDQIVFGDLVATRLGG